jgi:hypothetical protein
LEYSVNGKKRQNINRNTSGEKGVVEDKLNNVRMEE